MLLISAKASISKLADIEDSVRGTKIEIGDGVMIDAFVKIKPVGGTGDIFIGANSYVNSGCVIYSGNGVTIGRNVLIAANCTLAAVNHQFRSRDVPIAEQGFKPGRGGIVVEDDVWIGANCVIVDGAVIRRGAVVGAASFVNCELESYGIFVGTPARLVRHRT